MGYAVGSQCFGTLSGAAATACATAYPQATGSGIVSCSGGSDQGVLSLVVYDLDGANPHFTEVAVSFPGCDPEASYAASAELFAIALGAAAVLWVLKMAFRPLWSNQ